MAALADIPSNMADNSGLSQPGSLVSPASRGAAFLLDNGLSQRPLTMLLKHDQMQEARRVTAAKLKAEEDDKKYKEFYELTKDPNTKTFQPWQHEVDDDAQKFLSNAVSPFSRGTQQHAQYMGDVAKQKQLLESKAYKGAENGKIVTDAMKEVTNDPEYNPNAAAAVYQAVKDKKINDFQPSDITTALNNPANYNVAKIVDNQVKRFDTQVKELERRAGADFKTQAISSNIPLQFDEKGNPVIDKYTNRYAIQPNEAWVRSLDDNPKIKNILDDQIARQAALSDQALRGEIPHFQPKTRLQMAADLFQGQGTVSVKESLSPIPVHPPKAEKENQLVITPATTSYKKEYARPEAIHKVTTNGITKTTKTGGETYYGDHTLAGIQTNGKNNVVQFAPGKVYYLDGQNKGKVQENASQLGVSISSVGYEVVHAQDSKTGTAQIFGGYTAPSIKNDEQMIKFINDNASEMGKKYQIGLFAVGKTVDDQKVENDAAGETVDTRTEAQKKIDDLLPKKGGTTSAIRSKNNTVKVRIDDPVNDPVLNTLNNRTKGQASQELYRPGGAADRVQQAYQRAIESQTKARSAYSPQSGIAPKKADDLRKKYNY